MGRKLIILVSMIVPAGDEKRAGYFFFFGLPSR